MPRTGIAVALCLVALVTLVSLARPAAADYTQVWTTTADLTTIDAASESSYAAAVYDDVLALETADHNPGVPGGVLQPASVFVDDFRTSSADAETFRWVAGTCDQTGDQFIQSVVAEGDQILYYNYTGGGSIPVSVGDGVMAYLHNVSTPGMNSTRRTSAYVADIGPFVYTASSMLTKWDSGTRNFTLALVSDPDAWCGGFQSVGDGAALSFIRGTGPTGYVAVASAYVVDDGAISFCDAFGRTTWNFPVGTSSFTSLNLEIRRGASTWTWRVNGQNLVVCPAPYLGPVYAVLDFNSTGTVGGAVLFADVSSDWLLSHQSDPFPDAYVQAQVNSAQWRSDATTPGSPPARALEITVRIRGNTGAEWTICGPRLIDAFTLAFIQGTGCISPVGQYQSYTRSLRITATDTGSFRVSFEFAVSSEGIPGGSAVANRSWVDSVEITLTSLDPVGGGDGPGPPALLDEIAGGVVFCGIGVAVFVVFLSLMKRVRGNGGG